MSSQPIHGQAWVQMRALAPALGGPDVPLGEIWHFWASDKVAGEACPQMVMTKRME